MLHSRVKIGDDVITPSVSIGVAVGKPGRDNTADLLGRADWATLTAKRGGGNQVAVCADDISSNVVFRNDIELHLQAGIDSDALLLHYLPEVDGSCEAPAPSSAGGDHMAWDETPHCASMCLA
ncbi:MAG: hypothetical protein ACLP75_05940 [Mycobacterium sp.]|uniref:hypothetical protein n=1 Tax=Mycobacterium sp. TaxID=1785 RepID=UPI003F9C1725